MPTRDELKMLQALPLDLKVRRTMQRIKEWVDYYGEEGVYVSFSGGKDSTVLLDIVRNKCGYKYIPFVFVNTGLEYPEIVQFVKQKKTEIDYILRPKMNFKQVINKYGYPFIGKEVSGKISEFRTYKKNHDNPENCYAYNKLTGNHKTADLKASRYNYAKWFFVTEAPFEVSNKCCNVMKKYPVHKFAKDTGRNGITAQTAEESSLRQTEWIKNGCNAFDKKNPISNPMSFWTEQDVLLYIKENDLPICSVYGEVIAEDEEGFQYFTTIGDLKLATTGVDRTGCMFCGYGCHLDKNGKGRFELMKKTHPKLYDYIMRPASEGGLNYKEVIDWLNENGNLDIKY